MRVLVTGGTGFVGGFLVEELLHRHYQVRCLVLEGEPLNSLQNLPVEIIYGNICQIDTLYQSVQDVDYIYHLAAIKQSWDETDFYRVNVEGTENLIRATLRSNNNLKKFLYVSTQAAVGPSQNGQILTEDAPCHPVDHYGKSKRATEELLLNQYTQLPTTIVRPASIYGPRNLGPSMTALVISLTRWGIMPKIKPYGRSLHPIHVRDVVRGFILAAEKEQATGQKYFLTNEEPCTWLDFARLCFRIREQKGVLLPVPARVIKWWVGTVIYYRKITGRPYRGITDQLQYLSFEHWLCSGEKAKQELGFEIRIPLVEGLKETIDWFDTRNGRS
ncbi:MAG: NAD-dependent epimerase/dehydratase family protein [Fidelibacterota bacterium]